MDEVKELEAKLETGTLKSMTCLYDNNCMEFVFEDGSEFYITVNRNDELSTKRGK